LDTSDEDGGRGDAAMLRLFLDKGASYDPQDFDNQTPLTLALSGGRTSVVEFLERGMGEKSKNQALFCLIREQPVIIRVANSERGERPSDEADPFARIAALLLEKGVQTNARDEGGSTPLIDAAAYGRSEIVKVPDIVRLLETASEKYR
jgi:hypothetical protein